MIRRYIISFLVTLLIATGICSTLPFATRSRVQAGTAVEETWKADFILGAPDGRYFIVDDDVKSDLEHGIKFIASGPVRIVSAKVDITPKDVTWTENKTNHTAPGAGMIAHVKWDTPADAPNADRGTIHIAFPTLRGIAQYDPRFENGSYQMTGGQWVFREITAYRKGTSLELGQLCLALGAGLPLTMVIVGTWSLIALRLRERTRQKSLDSAQPPALPLIFLPSPTAEWSGWNLTLLIFSYIGVIMAACAISDGYMSTVIWRVIMVTQLAGVLFGLMVILATRSNAVTVQVDADTLSYGKGRGEPQWMIARWADLRGAVAKSSTYRGNRSEWLEVEFPDGQKRRIRDPNARQAVANLYGRFHQTAKTSASAGNA